MEVDIKALTWKDSETGRLYRVTHMEPMEDVVVLWFIDKGTGEQHCMSDVLFTNKFEACGSMVLEREEY